MEHAFSFSSFFYKRVSLFFLSLWIIITATFFLMHAIPGDPFTQDKTLSEEVLQALYTHYGLDKPLWMQYLLYLQGICTGNLGPSLKYEGRMVSQLLCDGFPISCYLGLQALCIAIPGGLLLGTLAATCHRSFWDKVFLIGSTCAISLPGFIVATLLQYTLAVRLPLFPVARLDSFVHTILPSMALSILPLFFVARLARVNMVEVLAQDYIQTAKAKGLTPFSIIYKHALRNILLPILGYLGPLMASVLTGGFAVEKIFGLPGLGQWFVLSISNRDYPVIMGITIFYSALLMSFVLLSDLLTYHLDPRTKQSAPQDILL